LGIDTLDEQHKELVECVNRLVRECSCTRMPEGEAAREKRAKVGALLDELYDSTRAHFVFEEDLMIREEYPLYSMHAREHVMLLAELKSTFASQLRAGCCNMSVEILAALKTWFVVHVSRGDRAFASYLLERHAHQRKTGD
jgi:hemerythrin